MPPAPARSTLVTEDGKMRRIIVASDGSKGAIRAEERAIELARENGAAIEFVTVSQPPLALGFTGIDSSFGAEETLDTACRRAAAAGVRASGTVLHGCAGREIADYARRRAADLIVVGPREHGLLWRLVVGSVSRSVMREAPVPVLVADGTQHAPAPAAPSAPTGIGSFA
jgi:nucleotide-binding universal stress UspA family protein